MLQIALANQPALRAAQASLASAQTQLDALQNLRLAGLVSQEIPIRRKQASLGVVIAGAEVNKIEWDTIYGVTRNYFSAIYAHKQELVLRKVIDNLVENHSLAKGAMEAEPQKVSKGDVDRLGVYTVLARTKLIEAATGVEKAKAAMREAMGIPACQPLFLIEAELPPLETGLCKEQLIELALARRGELIRATTGAEVVCLEVSAQGVIHQTVGRTFAAGSDLHATPVPQGVSNGEYRPWAIGIEMPTTLVGHKADRVRRAQDLHAKAVAVADKARQLIALEAAEAFLKWQDASKQVDILADTPKATADILKQAQAKFKIDKNTANTENLINSQVLDAQVNAKMNEALYQHALAVAALERITAGGFVPSYRRAVVGQLPH